MRATEGRIARLEQRLRDATALSDEAICARAAAFYEYGPEVAPLPENLGPAQRSLVRAMLDMLERTEMDRQFSDPRPLPLPSLAREGDDG